MIIESSLLIKWGAIFLNRVASWFGSGYFLKRGIEIRKWAYFVVAGLIGVVMFLVLLYWSNHGPVASWLSKLFSS